MIILDIKPYCHECPMFKPTKDVTFSGDTHKDTYVRCSNHIACDIVERHLELSKSEDKSEDKSDDRKIGY